MDTGVKKEKLEYKSYIIRKNEEIEGRDGRDGGVEGTEGERMRKSVINRNYYKNEMKMKANSATERRPREKRRQEMERLDPVVEEIDEKKPETGSNPIEFYDTTQLQDSHASIDALTHNNELMEELDLLKNRLKTVFKSISQERSPAPRLPVSTSINLK